MASPELCAMPVPDATDFGALPTDAVHEILLRLPARALCRLRAVCRSWRSLLSDPLFAAAHAARHPEPLIMVGYNTLANGSAVQLMDLSGRIVKQVRIDGHRVMTMPLNLVSVREIGTGSCRLVDPATAAMYRVRENPPRKRPLDADDALYLFGQVASTREYKAFRKVGSSHDGDHGSLYEVCTLSSSSSSSSSSHPRWRVIQGPPNIFRLSELTSVVIDGVVYILIEDARLAVLRNIPATTQDWIFSFDLETEKWRSNIKGPQSIILGNNVNLNHHGGRHNKQLTLADLNGSLVVVHCLTPCMDLWFLIDFDKGLWVKQYSIPFEQYLFFPYVCPLTVLDDGRVVTVTHIQGRQLLEIYDPRTNGFSIVEETMHSRAISVYTGNLLSLEWTQPTNSEKEVNKKVTCDGAERIREVPEDPLGVKSRWMTGLCQIELLCALSDAFLSLMFRKSPG